MLHRRLSSPFHVRTPLLLELERACSLTPVAAHAMEEPPWVCAGRGRFPRGMLRHNARGAWKRGKGSGRGGAGGASMRRFADSATPPPLLTPPPPSSPPAVMSDECKSAVTRMRSHTTNFGLPRVVAPCKRDCVAMLLTGMIRGGLYVVCGPASNQVDRTPSSRYCVLPGHAGETQW